MRPPIALTIAGLDPTGSSGIQADLPTFAALGVHGLSVATVVTAQDSSSVQAFHGLSTQLVEAQLTAVVEDFSPRASKTGLLKSIDLIELVESMARAERLGDLVVDPVMVDSSGSRIVEGPVVEGYRSLAGLATVITPNRSEAEILAGQTFDDVGAEAVCSTILGFGVPVVVVTGGRGHGQNVEDIVAHSDGIRSIVGQRLGRETIRGTGCTFSAALAASIASGAQALEAAQKAHDFVQGQLRLRSFVSLGSGRPGVPHVMGTETPR